MFSRLMNLISGYVKWGVATMCRRKESYEDVTIGYEPAVGSMQFDSGAWRWNKDNEVHFGCLTNIR